MLYLYFLFLTISDTHSWRQSLDCRFNMARAAKILNLDTQILLHWCFGLIRDCVAPEPIRAHNMAIFYKCPDQHFDAKAAASDLLLCACVAAGKEGPARCRQTTKTKR